MSRADEHMACGRTTGCVQLEECCCLRGGHAKRLVLIRYDALYRCSPAMQLDSASADQEEAPAPCLQLRYFAAIVGPSILPCLAVCLQLLCRSAAVRTVAQGSSGARAVSSAAPCRMQLGWRWCWKGV
jgi:hypothetical protein